MSPDTPFIPHSRPWITSRDDEAVRDQLASGRLAYSDRVKELEREVAAYTGASYGLAATGCSAALSYALKALGAGAGDEVILPTYVCRSVYDAVRYTGAVPVLSDIGEHWNITVKNVKDRISPRTKAVIVPHIFGIRAGISSFSELGIPVIEDSAQSFGPAMNGNTGSPALSVFSFHATKCLTAGEGGMVVTNDQQLYGRLLELAGSGFVPGRMSDLQAALGLSQLRRYSAFLSRRKEIAGRYFRELPEAYTKRLATAGEDSVLFRFPLWMEQGFTVVQEKFESAGIAVRRGVDALLHRPSGSDADFPQALQMFNHTVSIPLYPALTDGEVSRIIAKTQEIWAEELR